jgi:putative metalloprotease
MLKLSPLLLAVAYGLAMYLFSAWRTRRVLDANSTELADPLLRVLTDRMARALGLERIRVRIYEIEPVNGLADPDGRIYLTRGFYNRYRAGAVSADELASVIAHELGHVALGHTRRRMIDFTGQNAVFMSLTALVVRMIPWIGPLIAVWAARMITAALAARMSRADEYEADAWAAALLTKCGIGTTPQKALLAKLGRLAGDGEGGGEPPAWLLSHPRPAERIAAIEALEGRWSRSLPGVD